LIVLSHKVLDNRNYSIKDLVITLNKTKTKKDTLFNVILILLTVDNCFSDLINSFSNSVSVPPNNLNNLLTLILGNSTSPTLTRQSKHNNLPNGNYSESFTSFFDKPIEQRLHIYFNIMPLMVRWVPWSYVPFEEVLRWK